MRRITSESYFKRLVLSKISKNFYYHNNVSCGTQLGVPDTWVEGKMQDVWLEFKILKSIPYDNKIIDIRKLTSCRQKNWFKRRMLLVSDVLLVIGFTENSKIRVYHTDDLSTNIDKKELLKFSLTLTEFSDYIIERLGLEP